jgi:hypothetical protein
VVSGPAADAGRRRPTKTAFLCEDVLARTPECRTVQIETVRNQALQNTLNEKSRSTIDSDAAVMVDLSEPMKADRRQSCRRFVSDGQRLTGFDPVGYLEVTRQLRRWWT